MAKQPRETGGTFLLAVQSVACAVLLLIALVIRLIGGRTEEETRAIFRTALLDNGLADTVVALLDEHA